MKGIRLKKTTYYIIINTSIIPIYIVIMEIYMMETKYFILISIKYTIIKIKMHNYLRSLFIYQENCVNLVSFINHLNFVYFLSIRDIFLIDYKETLF